MRKKILKYKVFHCFKILSGITLHKHFHRIFTPSDWLEQQGFRFLVDVASASKFLYNSLYEMIGTLFILVQGAGVFGHLFKSV